MKKEHRYFNFPIQLLTGFMVDSKKSLHDIYCYSAYEHSLKMINDTEIERIIVSAEWFGIKSKDHLSVLKNGKTLYDSIPLKSPKTGINLTIWWDFYNNDKTEFDKICLLGFLALKSIVQQKSYCKTNNKLWLARMNGNSKCDEFNGMPEVLNKYNTERLRVKIKNELQLNWGLVHYSHYTRGFYISFKINLDSLVLCAESKRKSNQLIKMKTEKKQAMNKAKNKLNVEHVSSNGKH